MGRKDERSGTDKNNTASEKVARKVNVAYGKKAQGKNAKELQQMSKDYRDAKKAGDNDRN